MHVSNPAIPIEMKKGIVLSDIEKQWVRDAKACRAKYLMSVCNTSTNPYVDEPVHILLTQEDDVNSIIEEYRTSLDYHINWILDLSA
jgi:hypothetical protein